MKKYSILPGFWPCFIYMSFYLILIVIIPLGGLLYNASNIDYNNYLKIILEPRVIASIRLTFMISFYAALFNSFFGFLVSYVLVRYDFWGKKIIDAAIDLPFALPTAIAGIALSTIYSDTGWLGRYLTSWGIEIVFNKAGMVLALIFVTLPFVVRTTQPVLIALDKDIESAAASLGASKFTIFTKIIIPTMIPSVLTGFALAFARGLSEYGSVIFISSNLPKISEIISLVIINNLEQYDYPAAVAVASLMLIVSFVMLLAITFLQRFSSRYI